MQIKNNIAIIFDMDGVLVDSEPVINLSVTEVLKSLGIPAEEKDFLPLLGRGEDNLIAGVMRQHSSMPYTPAIKQKVYETYVSYIHKVKPFDGVRELIAALHNGGVPFAVASSADIVKVKANLGAMKVPQSLFGAIITGDQIKEKKPAPDCFLAAARALGMPPGDCVVVEDAVNGVRAAKNAGMRCIALLTSYGREDIEAERPDYICEKPGGLLSLLQKELL